MQARDQGHQSEQLLAPWQGGHQGVRGHVNGATLEILASWKL